MPKPESLSGLPIYKGGSVPTRGSEGDFALPSQPPFQAETSELPPLNGVPLDAAKNIGLNNFTSYTDGFGRTCYVPKPQEGQYIPD